MIPTDRIGLRRALTACAAALFAAAALALVGTPLTHGTLPVP